MDDPNVLEIWNLVFIQFNREPDSSLKSLPAKHVDTGMGMERVTSILQDKISNYATDVFAPIFAQIQKVTGAEPYTDKVGSEDVGGRDMAYRVVADHIRTLCFAIADGARPGSEGRDYVLRRVLRRGVRYGQDTLKAPAGFFHGLVDSVVASMGHFYPELVKARDYIVEVISQDQHADQLMAEEQGLEVSIDGFNKCMDQQRERSRAGAKSTAATSLKFQAEATAHLQNTGVGRTQDAPKYQDKDIESKVMAILSSTGFVNSSEGCEGPVGLVLDSTNFYAEQGGQVADVGSFTSSSGRTFEVQDTQVGSFYVPVAAGYVLHIGQADGAFTVGDKVVCQRDQQRRQRILPNHTFTHVLNYALREVLGDAVHQKGSIVLPDKLRFDFSHNGVIDAQKLGDVEGICRQSVQQEQQIYSKEVSLEEAQKINEGLLSNPTADSNRQFSVEFCGGTHLKKTTDAGAFALISEEGIAKGIRRLVAVTGKEAAAAIKEGEGLANQLAAAQKLHGQQLETEVAALKQTIDPATISAAQKAALRDQLASLQKRVLEGQKKAAAANKQRATQAAVADADKAVTAGQRFGIMRVDVGLDPKALLEAWNAIQKQHPKLPVIMFSTDEGKGKALAYTGVPADLAKRMPAGEWLKAALDVLGGKGGGKPTNAQGQGPHIHKLSEAMNAAKAHADLIMSSQ
ncbi:MAG: Alanyl-tRNA synthetase [Trebouxia sp. A1-2]|nr:MAG: Alanyl-tRNA synthetase [Trebouxia sp. A1-2]